MNPFNPLPSLKQQFLTEHFEPVQRTVPATLPELFERAKADYEKRHGHEFPHSFRTFERMYAER